MSVAHHKNTLKELILNSNPTYFDGTFDGPSPRYLDTAGVYHLDLDFFGLNCRLTDAKSRFHLVSGAENLKILHIRRGPHDGFLDLLNNNYTVARDLDELCSCVFGPKGLPKLDGKVEDESWRVGIRGETLSYSSSFMTFSPDNITILPEQCSSSNC